MSAYAWTISGNGSISGAANGATVNITAGANCNNSFTLTLTVTDANGCTASSSKNVLVQDNTPPTWTSVAGSLNTTLLCSNAAGLAAANLLVPSASDNCATVLTPVKTSGVFVPGSCAQAGTYTNTWTLSDPCGNAAATTFTQVITIIDNVPPVITCPSDRTVNCQESKLPANTGSATATDNCTAAPVVTYTDVTTPGSCGSNYVISRTWLATDNCSNASSCLQTITVQDITPPVITCPANLTISCENSSAPAATGTATATDNCTASPIITYTDAITPGSCINNKVITRTWRATDACGNFSTCNQNITVQDITLPIISCPGLLTVDCITNVPAPDISLVTTSDNCGTPTVTFVSDFDNGLTCPKTITRTYLATDDCGNTASCSQTIVINDITPPIISCPANTTISCENSSAPAATGTATATDNCTVSPLITYSDAITPGSCLNNRVISRTWRAIDDCGNISTSVQTITIQDITAPVPIGVFPSGGSGINACIADVPVGPTEASIAALYTDNCSGVSVIKTAATAGNNCAWSIIYTYTITDDCGNTVTPSPTVTYSGGDYTPPTANPMPVLGPYSCYSNIPPPDILNVIGEADNCGGPVTVTFVSDGPDPGCSGSVIRTYTITDACGNSASINQTINILHNTPPVIIAGANGTSECQGSNPDANTNYIAWLASNGGATATDFCGNAISWTNTPGAWSGGCNNSRTVTFTATDACGNSSTTSRTFTISDNTPPVIIAGTNGTSECQGNNPNVNTDYMAWLAANGGATATDLCGNVISWTNTPATWSGGCNNSITVTFRATDACGNFSTTSMTFTISDTTPPMIIAGTNGTSECQGNDPNANTNYNAWLAANGGATATDLCGNAISWTNAPGAWSGGCVNSITVIFTATDACGNASTTSGTFTISDTTPPVIIAGANGTSECQGNNPNANTNYLAWLAANGGATASDLCGNAISWSNSPGTWSGGCINSITVTFTATDACGNARTTSSAFTISDTNPPLIIAGTNGTSECQGNNPNANTDYIAWLSANGGATASDLCGNAISWTNTPATWSGGCINTIIVTFRATDACGNFSTTSGTFTISDNTPPVIVAGSNGTSECQGNNPNINTNYLAWLSANGGATATDLCGNAISWTNTPGTWSGGCVNSITVTFTATDACGNFSTTSGTFTISDSTPPVIVAGSNGTSECQGSNPDANTNYLAWLAANGGATASDLCGNTISWSSSPGIWSGGCVNSITVTFTATDACGNASTTSGVFTISDTTPPVITAGTNGTSECQGNNPDANTDYLAWLVCQRRRYSFRPLRQCHQLDVCSGSMEWRMRQHHHSYLQGNGCMWKLQQYKRDIYYFG